ncbi:ACT domain-containing protein [Deinococcus radiomollis]|uniref:ACT domain-containing protein n=1 Tax=Deinococcus radiomollis TaxID=468916 RepID=UPI003891E37F
MLPALSLVPGEYAVCRLSPAQPLPGWATVGELFSVTRTPDELSVVCAAGQVPADVRHTPGWAALKLHGPFDFALTGILAGVLNPLHAAGVGIFALSTYDTDYVLVQAAQLAQAASALMAAGYTVLAD